MGSMVVRNIPDEVLKSFKDRAKSKGKSAEQLLREMIAESAKPSREDIIREMDRIRAMSKPVDLETARRVWAEHIEERDSRPFVPNFPDDH